MVEHHKEDRADSNTRSTDIQDHLSSTSGPVATRSAALPVRTELKRLWFKDQWLLKHLDESVFWIKQCGAPV